MFLGLASAYSPNKSVLCIFLISVGKCPFHLISFLLLPLSLQNGTECCFTRAWNAHFLRDILRSAVSAVGCH